MRRVLKSTQYFNHRTGGWEGREFGRTQQRNILRLNCCDEKYFIRRWIPI